MFCFFILPLPPGSTRTDALFPSTTLVLSLLFSSAATLALPIGFRLVIDRGFMGCGDISRWFEYLFLIVAILALATAARFYFVSWLGERVVADIRSATQANLLRQEPRFFEEIRPSAQIGRAPCRERECQYV